MLDIRRRYINIKIIIGQIKPSLFVLFHKIVPNKNKIEKYAPENIQLCVRGKSIP